MKKEYIKPEMQVHDLSKSQGKRRSMGAPGGYIRIRCAMH